jgi:hypothetical protein
MAINVNKVYRVVLSVLNKEQRGYLTPDQFNRIARQAQLDLFDKMFYDYNRAVRKQAIGDFVEFADIASKIKEKIDIFHVSSTLSHSQGIVNIPDSVYQLIGVYSSDRLKEFEEVKKTEVPYLLMSKMTSPSSVYPIYYQEGNSINIFPSTYSGQILIDYVIGPSDPIWAHNGGGANSYTYSPNNSVDFEIHPSEEVDLVSKILAYSGVIIKDPTVIQVAAQKEASDFNQDNI